jgi:hypothetical protein
VRFFLNALSADRQLDADEVEAALEEMLACLTPLRLAFRRLQAELIVDEEIWMRALCHGSPNILRCIEFVQNRDLVRRWFGFIKNYGEPAGFENDQIEISAAGQSIVGDCSSDILVEDVLLGFGGKPVLNADQVSVKVWGDVANGRISKVVSRSGQIWLHVPKYDPSSKHAYREYLRRGGDVVSKMTIEDLAAQEALICSVPNGNHRYGTTGDVYIRFMPTGKLAGSDVFHGYEVSADDVPEEIRDRLRELREIAERRP